MARVLCAATTAEISLSAATAKTVLQLRAAANHRVVIKRIGLNFKGTTVTEEPGTVQVIRQTSDGTLTTLTARKLDPSLSETVQTGAYSNATVEPTDSSEVVDIWTIHPQSSWEVVYALGDEIEIAGSGRIGIKATFDNAVTVIAKIVWEE